MSTSRTAVSLFFGKYTMKHFVLAIIAVAAMSGCATNLTQSDDLPTQALASEIAQDIQSRCKTYEYDLHTKERKTGNVKVAELPVIKAIKRSAMPSEWVRAETVTNGKFIDFHFSTETRKTYCSTLKWQADPVLSQIQF
jgi:outer membrane lipoprotein-sorting protein